MPQWQVDRFRNPIMKTTSSLDPLDYAVIVRGARSERAETERGVGMSRDDGAGAKLDASAASFTFKPDAASFVPTGGASATPFYPSTQRSGYDEHLGQDQPRPETLPKKQSFTDLGLDSLGFVSDEEGGDAEPLDAASPLTKQRRDEVVQQLEGGMLLNNRRQQSGEYHQYHAQEYHPAQAQEYHPAQAQEYQEYHPAQAREYREFHPAQTSREYQAYYPGGYSGFDESDGGGEGYGGASDNEHMDEHEFLQFLMESYRGYSLESLTELLEANNGDIALTVEILSELDAEVEPPEPPALDDEELFPTLGGDVAKPPVPSANPELSPPEPPRSFTLSGGMSNVREGNVERAPGARVGASDENGNKFADRLRTAAAAAPPRDPRGSVTVGYGSGNFSGRRLASSQPWVDTGEAVSHLYATTREDAKGHLRARNVCFQQATQAYLSGNKALAKDLSRKGREHARLMAAAHANAAETIFRERNTGVGGNGPRMFDLHGLHVQEAIAALHRELGECAARGDGVAHVLVGTGHHTKGSRTPSRLPAAVAEYLAHKRVRFWEPQAGMLEVDVASGDFFS